MYFKINKTLIAKFLVIIGSHFAHVISVGMSMSFGILYSEIRSDFGVSQSEASWTASIFLGLLGITGVPLCAIVPYAGERLTTFIGTILLCSGMIASSFVQNYNWFYLTYGVIAGLGGGILHYTGSVVLVKHFHSKWRPFAVAIANAGVSVSALVLPPLMVACNEAYSWRRTFVVLGCISSVGLFSAATFYQPEIAAPTDTNIDDNVEKVVNNGTTTGQTLKQQVSEIVHNVDYMTFTLSSVLTLLVVFNPPTFLPDLMLESNIEEYQISWCIMSMGFGSLFGRIICGIVASRCGHVQLIQGVVLFGYATTAILMVFVHSFVPFMILTTLAGAFNGGYFGLLLSVVAHHLKTEQVATGFGMTYTGCGLATIAGMPLAGFVTEYFKSEGGAFIFSGCVMMFATLVLCFIKIRHWFKSKEDKSNNNINDNTFVVISASTHL